MNEITLYLKSPTGFKDNLPRSDTLFGAICWGVWLLYGEDDLNKFLDSYKEQNPVVLLSSSFPFSKIEQQITHFFPKPHQKPLPPINDIKLYKLSKKFNKVKYIDDQLFQDIINNGYDDQQLWERLLKNELYLSEDNKILSKRKLKSFPIKIAVVPGNAIDRLSNGTIEGKLYHTSECFIEYESGIFVLLKVTDEWLKKILAVFRYYADKGLGGDTSVGKGSYKLAVKENFPFQENPDGKRWLTLSLYFPEPTEWQLIQQKLDETWYSLTLRKGKIESNYSPTTNVWKKSLLMLEEGSVFPVIDNKTYYGMLPVVKEIENQYKVYQYGLAFSVKMG
jgi:CRISPR-associated protein Csm4